MTPAPPASPSASDDPRYLTVISTTVRIAAIYFAVMAVALVIDLLIVEGAFRTWPGFILQAVAALALGFVVLRGEGLTLCILLSAGVLAGGFVPDREGYSRRAPEPFVRMLLAIVPAAIAASFLLRSAAPRSAAVPVAMPSGDPPLTGTAREAAATALELLDACEAGLSAFELRSTEAGPPARAEIDRVWATLDGYQLHLRALPVGHHISTALQDGVVAYVDAATLSGFVHGAHAAMKHSPESAARFTEEVAARRAVPGADVSQVAAAARSAARAHRKKAAELLHATRFGTTGA